MKNKTIALGLLVSLLALGLQASAEDGEYKNVVPLDANTYNKIVYAYPFLDWGASGWFSKSSVFPDAKVFSLKSNDYVQISSLHKNRPMVLLLGSITCPAYDLNLPKLKEVQKKYSDKIDFYTLYVRENHPTDMYKAHTDFDMKKKAAADLKSKDGITHDILIDDVKGTLHQALGNFGNAVYLVGTDGHLNHWSPFTDPDLLEKGIKNLIAANGIAAKAKWVDGMDVHPLASKRFTDKQKMETMMTMQSRKKSAEESQKESDEAIKEMKPTLTKLEPSLGKHLPETWEKLGHLKKADWDMFASVFKDLRSPLRDRYAEWAKANNVDKKEDVPSLVLRDDTPAK